MRGLMLSMTALALTSFGSQAHAAPVTAFSNPPAVQRDTGGTFTPITTDPSSISGFTFEHGTAFTSGASGQIHQVLAWLFTGARPAGSILPLPTDTSVATLRLYSWDRTQTDSVNWANREYLDSSSATVVSQFWGDMQPVVFDGWTTNLVAGADYLVVAVPSETEYNWLASSSGGTVEGDLGRRFLRFEGEGAGIPGASIAGNALAVTVAPDTVVPIPLPATLALALAGYASLLVVGRRRREQAS